MAVIALSQLLPGTSAVIQSVRYTKANDTVSQRLLDLGFVKDALVSITAVTPFQSGPLVVKLGMSRFALRQSEAARILVQEVS